MPSAFDEAGIRMLDSIREIFDILKFEFETVDFDLIQYNNFEELASALNNGKCPVVDVLGEGGMSHVMVATGIINVNGTEYIQLKNSYADNPFEQGEVQKIIFQFGGIAGDFFLIFSNFSQTFITNYITKAWWMRFIFNLNLTEAVYLEKPFGTDWIRPNREYADIDHTKHAKS